jgi:putative transposase
MVMGFIDAHYKDLGIEPICRELAVALSFYHTHAGRLADASKRSARAQRDDLFRAHIERAHAASFNLCGTRKI